LTGILAVGEEDAELYAAKIAMWEERFPAVTGEDKARLEVLGIETVRISICQVHEHTLLVEQSRRADDFWDDDQALAAAELARKLPRQPEVASRKLEMTTQGCDLMIDRWERLHSVLKPGKPWNKQDRDTAFELFGVAKRWRESSGDLDPPAPGSDDVVSFQSTLALDEVKRLESRQVDFLNNSDRISRDNARKCLAFPSREVWLVRRYEQACRRRFDIAYKRLESTFPTRPTTPPGRREEPAFRIAFEPSPAVTKFEEPDLFYEQIIAQLKERAPAVPAAPEPRIELDPEPESLENEAERKPGFKGNRRRRKAAQRQARKRNR
jgi:hypothetical protein